MFRLLFFAFILSPFGGIGQVLTSTTPFNITKTWSQAPSGYTYPINVFVPKDTVPPGGFPVCILLHGNSSSNPIHAGTLMIPQYTSILECHILIAPTGYQNSWNICAENSDAPDLDMISDLLRQLQGYTNVNRNKIRILGISNGAGLANRIFIENKNSGIDMVCAIVSHLNEAQYHSGNFYKPSGSSNPSSSFCGYDSIVSPLKTRKYLSISNDNDNLIPYNGGPSAVGVNFLSAETAAFNIAKYKGYTGNILSSGLTSGNPAITEFSYLSGDVVHIKGSSMHSTDGSQRSYVKKFFLSCNTTSGIEENNHLKSIEVHPNPASKLVYLKVHSELTGLYYTIHDMLGKIVLDGKINSENHSLDITTLPKGIYLVRLGDDINQSVKLIKE
jgi:poly(3-hydroxybutyrate) depolymerase